MTDQERLGERVLDVVLYAPIGLALEARRLLPTLADRGRGQVALTRLAGKLAIQQSQGVGQVIDELRSAVLSAAGLGEPSSAEAPEAGPATTSDEISLPIDGYQTMTATELLSLLKPLSDNDLDTLLQFEEQHRGRATVINRIRQLRH